MDALAMPAMTVLGLMSGTSMDGIDAAVVETDGEAINAFGPRLFSPYADDERDLLDRAIEAAPSLDDRRSRSSVIAEAEAVVTDAHGRIVERLLDEHPSLSIDLIGFHGQTILHAPERRMTVQIGDGGVLAQRLAVPVMFDMRAADMAAGGEGAPLVPIFHKALIGRSGLSGNVAVVNIGGVANITRIGADGSLQAGDVGPGNALLDDLIRARTGLTMDRDGTFASRGQIDDELVARWMTDPWFDRPLPKSLDRNAFSVEAVARLKTEDAAATLAGFTSRAIVKGIVITGGADSIVVVGGGARNPTLLKNILQDAGIAVETGTIHGWDSDFVEAQAFAYLAARARHGLPLTYPGTTGVGRPLTGGRLADLHASGRAPPITV